MSNKEHPDWEEQLKQALDAVSNVEGEEAPEVADLQMLAAEVLREQRQKTVRDLLIFWLAAGLVLYTLLTALMLQPVYFLIGQSIATGALLAGAIGYGVIRKRVAQ